MLSPDRIAQRVGLKFDSRDSNGIRTESISCEDNGDNRGASRRHGVGIYAAVVASGDPIIARPIPLWPLGGRRARRCDRRRTFYVILSLVGLVVSLVLRRYSSLDIRDRAAASAGPSSRKHCCYVEGGFRTIAVSSHPNTSSEEPSSDAAIGGPDQSYSML